MLFPYFLTLHLIGLTMMAGVTLVDYISYATFWKIFNQHKEKSAGALQVMYNFSRLLGIGAILLIFSGIGMMVITNSVFGEQLWFRIKAMIVVALLFNGLLVGRRLGIKLKKVIADNDPSLTLQVDNIRMGLKRFHVVQLCLLLSIVLLSVFKFN